MKATTAPLSLAALAAALAAASTASASASASTSPPPPPPPPTRGGAACASALDCQLNGACVAGACVCGAAWTGASCGALSLLPAVRGAGFGGLASPVSSWGAGAARDPATGKFVMMVDEMSLGCGLGTWGRNSRCVLAMADSPLGPYARTQVLVDAWCHGSSLARDPVSGRWVYNHMGNAGRNTANCAQGCADGITPPNATTGACAAPNGTVPYTQGAFVSTGADPAGPYALAPSLVDGANCEPFFLDDGALIFACPWSGPSPAPNCGAPTGHNAFLHVLRADSLDAAIAGNVVELNLTYSPAGSNGSQVMCIEWEDQNIWRDSSGYFHTLMHAFRGQNTSYPLPGCFDRGDGAGFQPPGCTALGGHAFSLDASHWWISGEPAYTPEVHFDDGSVVTFRARERPHIISDASGEAAYFVSAVGNPGPGGNTGVPGADHTFTLVQQLGAL
jgi:hypothetical protein